MSIFVVGDLQGCCHDFQQLLEALPWKPGDELWLCGDLINRGPDSLGTLRFLREWDRPLRCVLGNHDLAVLAHASGLVGKCGRTAKDLLAAQDGAELMQWLRQQKLLVADQGLVMVHAGLAPGWSLADAQTEAEHVESQLRDTDKAALLFAHMYGDEPRRWENDREGTERSRFAINALTRMRFVHADGALDFQNKGAPENARDTQLIPWFTHPQRQSRKHPIVFGHWSTLDAAYIPAHNVWGVDTGCVWGGKLTALQWPERRLFQQSCPRHQKPGK